MWGYAQGSIAENHIRALLTVLTGEREWIRNRIQQSIESVLGVDEFRMFMERGSKAEQGEVFALEEQIETVKERQLLEDISHTLTLYSHIVARERLGTLRSLVQQAETDGKHEEMLTLLAQAKEMEKLLQSSIILTKDS